MKFLVFLFEISPSVRCDMQSHIQPSARMCSANNSKMGAKGGAKTENRGSRLQGKSQRAAQKPSKVINAFPSPVLAFMFNVGVTHPSWGG